MQIGVIVPPLFVRRFRYGVGCSKGILLWLIFFACVVAACVVVVVVVVVVSYHLSREALPVCSRFRSTS